MKKVVFFQIAAVACITAGSVFLARAATVTVDVKKQYQRIAGFGTCSAWCGTLSASEGELLWSTTKGAGLSLHRIMIDRNGPDQNEKANAKLATGYGVTVWGTPWYTKGGVSKGSYDTLTESNYQAWADVLASAANSLKSAGSPLYAVSSQNEPDIGWTKYDPATLAKWVGKYLGPTMASKAPDTKVMGIEPCNWCGFSNYYKVFKADADAWKYSAILATHEYGCSPTAYPDITAAGKEFWQTEIYDTQTDVEDPGMGSALRVSKLIHEALTIASMNAWHFWWIKPCSGCNNGALWVQATNKPAKRLWIMGNWSRYARPGFIRVDATTAPASGVTVTAFRDSLLSKVVIVAINNNSATTSLDFSMAGTSPQKLTPCITDPTRDLVEQAAQTLSSSTFTYALPAQSVTSLVVDMAGTSVSPSRRATAGPFLSLQTHIARSTLWARFTAPVSGPVSLKLYDLKGDLLRTSSKIASSGSVCTAGFDLSGISADCGVLRVDHDGKTVATARVPLVKE